MKTFMIIAMFLASPFLFAKSDFVESYRLNTKDLHVYDLSDKTKRQFAEKTKRVPANASGYYPVLFGAFQDQNIYLNQSLWFQELECESLNVREYKDQFDCLKATKFRMLK
ncbi:MAG: hypothetical protein AB8E15_09480 [Bdellovibrionales bacterium]